MRLNELLTLESIENSVEVASKKMSLEVASEMLATSVEGVAADDIFSALLNRERLGSTGIGSGVGIPHCRINGADKAAAVLLSLKEPIDFDSIDNQPVDLICALIVPDDGNDEHLKTLAGLAELFSNPTAINALRSSETNEALYEAAVSYSSNGG